MKIVFGEDLYHFQIMEYVLSLDIGHTGSNKPGHLLSAVWMEWTVLHFELVDLGDTLEPIITAE